MPTFDLDIDIDEYVDALSHKEIKDLIQYLIDNDHISGPDKAVLIRGDNLNYSDNMWFETCRKLVENRLSLTEEETALIEKISQRFL
jgi:hypothetical protein